MLLPIHKLLVESARLQIADEILSLPKGRRHRHPTTQGPTKAFGTVPVAGATGHSHSFPGRVDGDYQPALPDHPQSGQCAPSVVHKRDRASGRLLDDDQAIAFVAKILPMDEPTAALGVREANTLLRLIKDLRDEGNSVVLITQRMPDILAIGDRVMVLKGGRRQGVLDVSQVGLDDVVELIVRGRAGAESDEDAMEYLSFG